MQSAIVRPSTTQLEPFTYTPQQLAERLGISTTMVYRMLQAGEIPRRRAGKRYIIPRAAVDEWLRNTQVADEFGK